MSMEAIVNNLKGKVEASDFGNSIKFDCGDEGVLVIDGNSISTDNQEADCTIGVSFEDLQSLVAGDLDPTAAFMQGKFTIDGDMSIAMKLSQLI
ncbi:SCP-2 sterol transfer family protein [Pseudovibrio axinellae]|uniref:SCP-2 sterol transfer family protein n=1 Tax=Pseudovibrio axinellae TaxID=989403 RepID=A0A165U190_9HYPH|nr:SCP2 sterol-binding domain-containing protein [Pseudovibrio axinellae]KZL09420.1 SCP-2 sterol transfer family protein [Pseudovibrio axinellae]SEQ65451.1 SCP-2 sterol transfer family protein [Pseudovibrio axinellae]